MAKRTFLAGATSQTIDVFIQDSSSTVGAGLSGLAFNTANLKAYYRKGATGSATAITLATQTVGGAWSSGGFVEIDATNMKGQYRFDVPDTILASTPYATIYFYGATNMAPLLAELEIVSYNPFTANLGLNNVPVNVNQWLGGTIPAVNVTGVPLVDAKYLLGTIFPTPTVAGIPNVNVKTWNDLTTVALPLVPTTAGRTLDVTAANKVNGVVLVDTLTTYTGNTPQTGDSFARIGVAGVGLTAVALSAAGIQAIWDALTSALTTVGSIGKLLVDNINATISSRSTYAGGAVASVSGNVGGNLVGTIGGYAAGQDPATLVLDTAAAGHNTAGTIGAKINSAASAGDPWSAALPGAYTAGSAGYIVGTYLDAQTSKILTSALTESYAALHAVPTAAQLFFEVRGLLAEKSVSGMVLRVNKLDGVTQAEAFTLDSATAPTAITRSA